MYRIDIMTLFPDTVGDVLSESILGRAQERDILRIDTHQIRDYTRTAPSISPLAAGPLTRRPPNGLPGTMTT